MRKSLLKTPPSGLSSRLAPPAAALVAVGAARGSATKRNGSAPYTGVPRVRVAVEEAPGEEAEQLAGRVRLLEGFVGRAEIADCSQIALQWLRDVAGIKQSICMIRPSAEG